MTATSSPAEPPESTLAAVLAEHLVGFDLDPDWCICGWRGPGEFTHDAYRLHVAAAILAATPTAAPVEADGLTEDAVGHAGKHGFCPTCGVHGQAECGTKDDSDHPSRRHYAMGWVAASRLVRADPRTAAHVAELEAALAAAEARLRAVEALAADFDARSSDAYRHRHANDYDHGRGAAWDAAAIRLRYTLSPLALATPPQPAP